MNVAIYGSADSSDKISFKYAREIGRLLATHKHAVITGACPGAPFEASLAAFNAGGRTIGYSPATNKKDHVEKFNDPIEGFTELIYVPRDYEYAKNIVACYKFRNIRTIMNSDKAIILGGRYGTLDEFIQAYEFGKEIGVMKNTKGAAEIIATDVMESTFKKVYKDTGAKVYFEENPRELLKTMGLI